MSRALLELYRHKTWATVRLIEHCMALGDEDLDATTAGTYGTIRATLLHMVAGDEDYFWMLTKEHPSRPLVEGEVVPLQELAERTRRLGPRWEELAQDAACGDREASADDGWRFPGAVPMAQALHHADDHRSHVLSILGARGREVPRLDVWEYARSHNLLQAPSG